MTFEDTIGRSRSREPVIKIHGPEAFAAMHKAGRLTAAGLDMLGAYVKPGVTTQRLDDLAFQFAMDNGAYPATLFYRGYTKSICTSINHVVCHGIPDDKPLREGDVLNIDYTLIDPSAQGRRAVAVGVGLLATEHRGRHLRDLGGARTKRQGQRCALHRNAGRDRRRLAGHAGAQPGSLGRRLRSGNVHSGDRPGSAHQARRRHGELSILTMPSFASLEPISPSRAGE